MLIKEAQWLADQLQEIPDESLFPLLNVGSSTVQYRTEVQPHIDQLVFRPLRARGGQVWHADMKSAPGVDIVGDLCEESTVDRLRQMGIRSVMASNLLEHVGDIGRLAAAVGDLVPDGGYIFVTGPYRYPYHPDPIDNGFRPEPHEVCALFPGTELACAAVIDAGNWRQWDSRERPWGRGRMLLRALIPFYKTTVWRDAARNVPYLIRHAQAFGVILRKRSP